MGRFAERIGKEYFMYCVKTRGWVNPGEAEAWGKIYDYAKNVENNELDQLLDLVASEDCAYIDIRGGKLKEYKERLGKLQLPEEITASVMALPEEAEENTLTKNLKEWDKVSTGIRVKILADNEVVFDAHFNKMDADAFQESMSLKGWSSSEHKFFRALFNAARMNADRSLMSFMEELINTDVTAADKRKEMVLRIGDTVKNVFASARGSRELNKGLKNIKETLTEEERNQIEEKKANIEKKKARIRAAEATDGVFIENAKKMGWKDEDVVLLNAITEAQKKIRSSADGEQIEELRKKIMETPIDPEKYYTQRNRLLKESMDTIQQKCRTSVVRSLTFITNAQDETKDFVLRESHEEDKRLFIEDAKKRGWDKAGDERILGALYDGRFNIDGKLNEEWQQILDMMQTSDHFSEYQKYRYFNRFDKAVRHIQEKTEAQKNTIPLLDTLIKTKTYLDPDEYKSNEVYEKPADQVRDTKMAEFYAITSYLTQAQANAEAFFNDLESKGFVPRIMGMAIVDMVYRIAKENLDPAGKNENEQNYTRDLYSQMRSHKGTTDRYPMSQEELDEKAKAEAYLEDILAERMKAYTALDPEMNRNNPAERAAYIEAGKQAGWNEPGDEELLLQFYDSRYDKDGNVIPAVDVYVRNLALQPGNLGVARRQWLTGLCNILNGMQENDQDLLSRVQREAGGNIAGALNRSEFIVKREAMADQCASKGWNIDRAVLRKVYEAYSEAFQLDKSVVISNLLRGRNPSYPLAYVEENGELIHLQSCDMLEKLRDELANMEKDGKLTQAKRDLIHSALSLVTEEIGAFDTDVIEREKEENERLQAEYRENLAEATGTYAERIGKLKPEDLDALEKASVRLEKDTPAITELKECAMLLAKEKESFQAALKDPVSEEAKPFMENLYRLERELDRFEREVVEKRDWPYPILRFVKDIMPDQWRKYGETAEQIWQLNEKAESRKEKMFALSPANLDTIAGLCENPPEGNDFPEELNGVLQWGRKLSQAKDELDVLKTQYDSVEGIRFKTRYMNTDDALGKLIDSVHPSRINENTVVLLRDFFPVRYEEYRNRKELIEQHTNGKDAFLGALAGAGWNTVADREFFEKLYDACLDVDGKAIPLGENSTFAAELRNFAAAKEEDVEPLYNRISGLRLALVSLEEAKKTDRIREAEEALNERMHALEPDLSALHQQRAAVEAENMKREEFVRGQMGLPALNVYTHDLKERRNAAEAEENRNYNKERLLYEHQRAQLSMEAEFARHGWNEEERAFFKELYQNAIKENGESIAAEGGKLTDKIVSLSGNDRDNYASFDLKLQDMEDFLKNLPEDVLTEKLAQNLTTLTGMKTALEGMNTRGVNEKALVDSVETMKWNARQPFTQNGWCCTQELYDEILSVSEKFADNEKIRKLSEDLSRFDSSDGKLGLTDRIIKSFETFAEIQREFMSLPDEQKKEAEKLIGDLSGFLTDPQRRQSYETALYKSEYAQFTEIGEKPFWKEDYVHQKILSKIFEAQYDRDGNKNRSIAELASQCATVDSEEKFRDLLSRIKERVMQKPEEEKSVAQQRFVIAVNGITYIEPAHLAEERRHIIAEQEEKDETRRIAKEKRERYKPFEDKQWVQDGDRQFIENILDARPAQNAQEYDRILEKLKTTQKARYWEVSDALGKLSDELKKIPEANRTDAQRQVLGTVDEKIAALNAFEAGWQQYRENTADPALKLRNIEKEKFNIIKSNLEKVEHAYLGHTNSDEYNAMLQKLDLVIQEPAPDRYAQLKTELGEAAKAYLDHTGLGKAVHSNSETRRKCAFLLMAYSGNEAYNDYATRANRDRNEEYKISVNALEDMPGVGMPAPARRNRISIAELNGQQAAEAGAGRNRRRNQQAANNIAGGNIADLNENEAVQNHGHGRRNGN